MHISGVLVHAHPRRGAGVRAALGAMPGVEIHGVNDDGRMVVTIESDTDGETADLFQQLGRVEGVLSVSLVYHQFEPHPEEEVVP